MRINGILLTELRGGWLISGLSPQDPSQSIDTLDPIDLANRTIAFAEEHSFDAGQVVIALASESVLFASLGVEVAANIKSNQSLRFSLESVLPVDAESIVAVEIQNLGRRSIGSIAAVCVEVSHLKPIVDALEDAQSRVQFIVPNSIVALEQALEDNFLSFPSISIWMLDEAVESQQVEIIVLAKDRSLSTWQISGLDIEVLEQHLMQLDANSLPVLLCGNEEQIEKMASAVQRNFRSIECDRDELSKKRARLILSDSSSPWVDFRRDELAMHDPLRRNRNSLRTLALSVFLLIATLCGTLLWQAQRYQTISEQYKRKQQDLFRTAFPAQRIPAAILGRLKSEHTKAKGIRKTDPKSATAEAALLTLHRIIGGMSDAFPFEVEEIRIENGRISMEVELLSQQDTGRIVAALAKQGFGVEPPSTTLVNGERILASINAVVELKPLAVEWDGTTIP